MASLNQTDYHTKCDHRCHTAGWFVFGIIVILAVSVGSHPVFQMLVMDGFLVRSPSDSMSTADVVSAVLSIKFCC